MVSREGLEPPFLWFVAIRFLRLSYRDIAATVSSVAPAAFWISSITRVLILRSQRNAFTSVLNLKLIGLQTSPAMAEWTGLEPATRISEHMISNHADYQLSHHSIFNWVVRWDLNPHLPRPQRGALPLSYSQHIWQ